ncbi:MAG: hypothetical protein LH467_14330 [Gemmatimonadaceae bacterium]|nr:hypothetical protein [Gemmatimonadaceae bacterium]
MSSFLPLLLFLLTALILAWNIVLAGRIAQVRTLPRAFVTLSALAGFLVVPALVVHLATTSSITGRALLSVDWLWPVTLVLFAMQALYAASRRLVNPFLGFFFAAYGILIAVDAVLRFVSSTGRPLPSFALIFLAATTATFAFVTQSPLIIGSPFFFFTPMIAPAFPALRNWAATLRIGLALVGGAWVVIFLSSLTAADHAVNSYDPHDPAVERLQERPKGDFQVGLKILEDLDGPPATLAVKNDLHLADTMRVDAVNVVIVPEQMDRAALDSLARIIDAVRVDSTLIIITLGYPSSILPLPGRTFSEAARLKTIDPIVRRLRPDVLIPAQDPFGAGTRAAGARPVEYWQSFLTRASAIAKRVRPRTKIGVSASVYDRRDSTLYAWAAAPGSPVDVVGFTLYPSPSGMRTLDAARGAADRWMQASRSTKDHWVFAVGGYPEAHGEVSQTRAVWAALAWATSRPVIKGLIVSEAGDYGVVRGLRAADGHLRGVTFKVMDAMRALRESAAPDSTLPELTTQKRIGS